MLFPEGSAEGLNTGLTTAQNQGMDVVGAFVGVNCFQVHDVADNVVFICNTVTTVHTAGYAGDVQGLAPVVTPVSSTHLPLPARELSCLCT